MIVSLFMHGAGAVGEPGLSVQGADAVFGGIVPGGSAAGVLGVGDVPGAGAGAGAGAGVPGAGAV